MKFADLFKVLEPGRRLTIYLNCKLYHYDSDEDLNEDFVFYEEIKNREVSNIWYSHIFASLVIEIK